MKKILISLFLVMFCLNISAQHMKFDGVEITGILSHIVGQLEEQGWKECHKKTTAKYPRIKTLKKSRWESFKDVRIAVGATHLTNVAYIILVEIPYDHFSESFDKVKLMLTSEFGAPVSEDETEFLFSSPDQTGGVKLNKQPENKKITCSYFDFEGFDLNVGETPSEI